MSISLRKHLYLILIAICMLSANAETHWESIVSEGNTFKYLTPETAPDATWTQLSYDDEAWLSGNGGFGYDDDDDNTVVPPTSSIYLRKKVKIPKEIDIRRLVLDIDYDDAYVAYINGVEIARSSNLAEGTPGILGNISTDHEARIYDGGLPERRELKTDILNIGDNILAIHVLNISSTSSDLSARVFLNAEIDGMQIMFDRLPSWFIVPASYTSSNLPIIKINTENQSIPDEPKIMATMQVINNANGINFFSDTTFEYNAHIGIEQRGFTSQGYAKKSYTVETRNEDGSNNNTKLLGMSKENDWVFHGPYSDKSMMRNALAYHLGNGMVKWCPHTRFAEVQINEEYKGVYLIAEKIKIDKNRVDIATLKDIDISGDELTGGYIISIDRDQEGSWNSPFMGRTGSVDVPFSYVAPKYDKLSVEQRKYIKDYIITFERALKEETFKDPDYGYRAYIDVQSFVDYFIITELSRDLDGYRVSVFFHKDKDSKGGKLTMGPFWDYNLCFGNADFMQAYKPEGWAADGIGNGDSYEVPFWWDRLREDPYFETVLKYRWEELRQTVISKEAIEHYIDSCHNELAEAQQRNFTTFDILNSRVWPNYYIGKSYSNEVNYLSEWMDKRIDWLDLKINAITPSFVPSGVEHTVHNKQIVKAGPNPFDDYFDLSIALEKEATIDVYIRDLLGKIVYTETYQGYGGKNTLTVERRHINTEASILVYSVHIDQNPVRSELIIRK